MTSDSKVLDVDFRDIDRSTLKSDVSIGDLLKTLLGYRCPLLRMVREVSGPGEKMSEETEIMAE